MTSWQGVLQGLMMYEDAKNAEADRAFERERFERTLLEQRRNALVPELRAMREARQARLQQVQTAVGIGLSQETATALQRSGQLGLFLAAYDENDGVDPQYIAALDDLVRTELSERGANDDTVAAAILAGTSTDRDVSDPDQGILAITESIITAQNFEELESAQDRLFETSATPTPIETFDISFGGMGGATATDTKAIRRELAETLNTYFQDSFQITDTGDVIINAPPESEVAQLFNEAERRARRFAFGPQRQFTPTDAANYVATQIELAATNVETVNAGDMFENFDLILTDPEAYAQQYTPPPLGPRRVEAPDPAATVGGIADALDPFRSIIEEETRNQ